jgi:flavin-binding protein dodecin
MYKLQMQVAIAEERFEDATALRDAIDRILASDRALRWGGVVHRRGGAAWWPGCCRPLPVT